MSHPPGTWVRLADDFHVFNLGSLDAGATGVVARVYPDAPVGGPIAEILMDRHFPFLLEWDNHLQVFRPDEGEVSWSAFEPTL